MADRWTGLNCSASTRSGEGACRANLRHSPEFATIGGGPQAGVVQFGHPESP